MILTSYFSEISSCIDGHLMVSTTTLSLSLRVCVQYEPTSLGEMVLATLPYGTLPSLTSHYSLPGSTLSHCQLGPMITRPTRQWLEKLTLAYFMAIPGFALALTTHDVVASWPCVISESWRE